MCRWPPSDGIWRPEVGRLRPAARGQTPAAGADQGAASRGMQSSCWRCSGGVIGMLYCCAHTYSRGRPGNRGRIGVVKRDGPSHTIHYSGVCTLQGWQVSTGTGWNRGLQQSPWCDTVPAHLPLQVRGCHRRQGVNQRISYRWQRRCHVGTSSANVPKPTWLERN